MNDNSVLIAVYFTAITVCTDILNLMFIGPCIIVLTEEYKTN